MPQEVFVVSAFPLRCQMGYVSAGSPSSDSREHHEATKGNRKLTDRRRTERRDIAVDGKVVNWRRETRSNEWPRSETYLRRRARSFRRCGTYDVVRVFLSDPCDDDAFFDGRMSPPTPMTPPAPKNATTASTRNATSTRAGTTNPPSSIGSTFASDPPCASSSCSVCFLFCSCGALSCSSSVRDRGCRSRRRPKTRRSCTPPAASPSLRQLFLLGPPSPADLLSIVHPQERRRGDALTLASLAHPAPPLGRAGRIAREGRPS
mmetsp:Transcript_3721/g.7814  ORF Transcript_3721/g.7814 Transcript_3721/m.7814 type:complete len:262 (-) Transcript_3721:899-1684(-)